MSPGTTFVNLNASSHQHLWFVCTTPDLLGMVVILNLTTERAGSDTACRLVPGDHPFVHHASVINYRDGQVVGLSTLVECQARNLISLRAPAQPALLARIRQGALNSRFAPHKIQCLIENC